MLLLTWFPLVSWVLYLLFRVVDWLMLVLVIGAVVYLLRSFYGIVCELSGVVERWLRLAFGLWSLGFVGGWLCLLGVVCLVFRLF